MELKSDFLILINFIICYIFFRGLYLFIKNYKLDFKIEITNFGFFTYSKSGFDLNKTIVTCFLSSLFIEFVQGFIPYRFCEIYDLWLNTLGGFIGGVIYIYLLKVSSRYTKFSNLN